MRSTPSTVCRRALGPSRALWLAVGLAACPGPPDDPDPSGTTPTEPTGATGDTATLTDTHTGTVIEEPPWPFPLPWLEGVEWVPGKDATLFLANVPPHAEVVFQMSEVGMERGDCVDPGLNGCPVLIDPVELGTAVADDDSYVEWSKPVDELGTTPRVVYLQAVVTDVVSGLSTRSSAIQRHVHVPASESRVNLQDVSASVGLGGIFTTGNSHTGGIAWPDFNGDHYPDLFIANGGGVNHRLFRNNGDGTFTDWSQEIVKPDRSMETAAVHFADIDNDGDVDLLAVVDSAFQMNSEIVQPLEGGPNLLYVNNGDGTFTEDAAARGLVDPRGWRNITAAFADFNADGFVDVHLGVWGMNQPSVARDGRLMLNDGTGHFVEASQTVGYGRDVLTSLAGDFDLDGWPDLYLGHVNSILGFHLVNEDADDVIYRNEMGTLVDAVPDSPGLGDDAWAAMGLDIADIDNDGDFDIYETDRWEVDDTLPRGNPLYLQNADGTFSDNVCDVADVCTSYAGWPTLFADFDRDGWVDLYVGTGKPYYPDLIYVNDGDGTFTSHWVPSMQDSPVRGGAQADFDGDGDVEFAVWQYNDNFRLFDNEARDNGSWLELRLQSSRGNPLGIGAVVRLLGNDGVEQLRRVSGGDSAHSQSSDILHFGLGNRRDPVDLEILWPGGELQRVNDVPVDGFHLVDRDEGLLPQEVLWSEAVYREATGEIEVTVSLRYGGRRRVECVGGKLDWLPDEGVHHGVYPVAEYTPTLTLSNERFGDVLEVPVTLEAL
jgi:hypothetical protein